jgi:hypothetical protein
MENHDVYIFYSVEPSGRIEDVVVFGDYHNLPMVCALLDKALFL